MGVEASLALGWLFLRVTDVWVSKRSRRSRMVDMVSSRASCLIPRWSTGASSTRAMRCFGSKYDSSYSAMLTAASTVVGCRCFTAKATCGLSSCVKYCCKASSFRASAPRVGNARSAKTLKSSPKSAHPSDFFFVRVWNSATYKTRLLSGSKRPCSALTASG